MSVFEHKCHLAGWVIFIFSALFFMTSSILNGDPVGFVGALLFLVACLVFIYPLIVKKDPE